MASSVEKKEGEESSIHRFKSICVFGGSKVGKDPKFALAAHELGKALGKRGINIVFGGGMHGVRGCMAISALVSGSKVLGVVVKDLVEKNVNYSTIGTELRVSSLPERLGSMFGNAEAFIALPGGLETLEGISSIAFWAKLNFHKRPLGLLNINGFYDGLLSFLDQAVEQDFITPEIRRTIISASTVEELIDQLQLWAPKPEQLVKQIDWKPPDSRRKPDTDLRL